MICAVRLYPSSGEIPLLGRPEKQLNPLGDMSAEPIIFFEAQASRLHHESAGTYQGAPWKDGWSQTIRQGLIVILGGDRWGSIFSKTVQYPRKL